MINNISIPDIYSKSNKTEKPLLKTLEIYFHTKDDYDIIINDEKCNYLKNTKKNIIIYFSDIQKYYRIFYINASSSNVCDNSNRRCF